MDFFQHRYYRLNKTLITLIGYWPYQGTYVRVIRSVVLIFILASIVVPQVLALMKYRDDQKVIFECVITFLFEIICAIKGLSMRWNMPKTLKLLNRIRTDWQVWARDRDVNILHEYAEQGRKMAIVYTAEIYAAIIVYVTQPIMPSIIDVVLKNGTAPGKFAYPVDFYFFDAQKYYWYVVMHTYVCVCMGLLVVVATEVMLIIYVQHVCGIFAALGRKFQRVGSNKTSVTSEGTPNTLDTVGLPSCIDRHNDAIRIKASDASASDRHGHKMFTIQCLLIASFANLIDATYTWNILFVTGFGIIMLNLVALQLLVGHGDPEATIRYIGVTLATILHLYVECDISENLMDSSTSIHVHIHNSQWYNLPHEAQKPLQLMMMLCRVPCQLTAGKYVTLSMRTFGQAVRTAMSYFTFVRSMNT